MYVGVPSLQATMKFIILGVTITLLLIILAIFYTLKRMLEVYSQWYAEHSIDK